MREADRDRTTSPPSRRTLLTGAASALAATAATTLPAAAASPPDPCLVIAAERDQIKALHNALTNRVHAIADANPLPMWGQGWPRADLALPVFNGAPFKHGAEISEYEIGGLSDPRKREALLRWWNDERAAMDRRGEETGYIQANDELDAMTDRLIDKECELADVQATTIAGAIARLDIALNTICTDPDPSAYERMALGALQDLKRLAATQS